jgi:hypothetical protein
MVFIAKFPRGTSSSFSGSSSPFIASSTFGPPTDAPRLARWAKALAIVVLIISRAVGVL